MFRKLSNYQRFSLLHKTSNVRWTSDLISKRSTEKLENKFEVQDPNLIFSEILKNLTQKVGGKEHLVFPKEIIFLAGAPGSGKGTMTDVIKSVRGLSSDPIVCSDLLDSKEMREKKNKGDMIGDKEVINLVFETLLDKKYQSGVILDGFPRTKIQAECISLLYDKMFALRNDFKLTIHKFRFRRPIFHILVLFCDEITSVERQVKRGQIAHKTKQLYEQIGEKDVVEEVRVTDLDKEIAKKRYLFFKDTTFESLKILREKFYYHFIDASPDTETVKQSLLKELKYQSSSELNNETFDKISELPLASEITANARYRLVQNLDQYCQSNSALFDEVVKTIEEEFVHIIRRQALIGNCIIRSVNRIFDEPLAVDMFLDVMIERGFTVTLDVQKVDIPVKIHPETFEIFTKTKKIFHFHIRFPTPTIRSL